MPKKDKTGIIKKNNAPLNGALKFFIGGCVAELYLLIVRRYYVNGTAEELIAWDSALQYLLYAGLAILAVGAVLAVVWKKAAGIKREAAWIVAAAGAFLAVSNWLTRAIFPNGVMIMCVLTLGVMLLGVLWNLYARECFYSMVILTGGVFATWVCRHGMDNANWKTLVIAGACVFFALMLAAILLTRKLEATGGLLGSVRVLPVNTDCTVLYVSAGISVAATVVAMFSAAAGYYALWILGIVIFILAVYYTVKEL